MQIVLADKKTIVDELFGYIRLFEQKVGDGVPADDPNLLIEELNERMALLATAPRMKEISTGLYNWAKGEVGKHIANDDSILMLKNDIQRLFISGAMSEIEAIYERTDKTIRAMEVSIEGIRTMISFQGKQINKLI